jgi:hypothetical protein
LAGDGDGMGAVMELGRTEEAWTSQGGRRREDAGA